MISLITTLTPPPSSSRTFKSPLLLTLRPIPTFATPKILKQRRLRNRPCRAVLSQDAPFVVSIGACILSDDEESNSVIDTADARFAVIGIISFIPYFNWLGGGVILPMPRCPCLFGFLLEVKFVTVMSPEESWLPFASIIFCIIHVQEGRKDHKSIPSAQEQSQNELGGLGVPRKPSLDPVNLNENEVEDERKH